MHDTNTIMDFITGKPALKYGVEIHVFMLFLPSYSVVGVPGKSRSSSLLKKFNPFPTVFGTVRFLICSGTRWRLNQWRTIKACRLMIQNVRKFIEIWGIPLLPLRSETVRATVPYFRRCFPVYGTVHLIFLPI